MLFAYVGLWFLSGIGGAGLTYAYFQRKYTTIAHLRRFGDTGLAILTMTCGPLSWFPIWTLYMNSRYEGIKMFEFGWMLPGTKDA